jgi:hypothetical protein
MIGMFRFYFFVQRGQLNTAFFLPAETPKENTAGASPLSPLNFAHYMIHAWALFSLQGFPSRVA